jgi:drug/metabolite transporter (DMT)-like permease
VDALLSIVFIEYSSLDVMLMCLDSLQHLPIAETMLLMFLMPIFTTYFCSLVIHQPFGRKQLLGALVSFLGVVMIARPDKLWFQSSSDPSGMVDTIPTVTPIQRLTAVILAIISDVGGGVAFACIRVIGSRAHPVLSVNYYAFVSMILSGIFLFMPFVPKVAFRLPKSGNEWLLLTGIGLFGFGLQFAMTAGLIKDKSARAVNMMYSSVVFGLGMDWLIWGIVPIWSSWVGGGVVITSTLWVAMQKTEVVERLKEGSEEYGLVAGEEVGDDQA